jgi:hypothetical protein
MSFTAFLIIAACVVAGYWIVSSVMEPGEDLPELQRKPEQRPIPVTRTSPAAPPAPTTRPASTARPASTTRPASTPRSIPPTARNTPALRSTTSARPAQPGSPGAQAQRSTSNAALRDWHIVLDLPQDAPRSEILAAVKRRVAQAHASGDTEAIARITQAGAAALRKR